MHNNSKFYAVPHCLTHSNAPIQLDTHDEERVYDKPDIIPEKEIDENHN